nr:photosystem II reaction center protein Ycf12/Psb30 [Phacus arnoldii]WCH63562.1 photosystem II reaction center protein Ycf12/Psb30 [Phacus arnoldii]
MNLNLLIQLVSLLFIVLAGPLIIGLLFVKQGNL